MSDVKQVQEDYPAKYKKYIPEDIIERYEYVEELIFKDNNEEVNDRTNIYLVRNKEEKKMYIMKIGLTITRKKTERDEYMEQYNRFKYQARMYNYFDKLQEHVNIIKDVRRVHNKNVFILIYDFYEKGDLFTHVIYSDRMDEDLIRKIFIQILDGVKYLHDNKIIHCDLKLENILIVNDDMDVKIIDREFCKYMGNENKLNHKTTGTLEYIAPEVLENEFNYKTDVWGLGTMLYIMITKSAIDFKKYTGPDYFFLRKKKYRKLSENLSESFPSNELTDLLGKLLTIDSVNRISIEEIYNHPWILCETEEQVKTEDVGFFQSLCC